MDGTTARRALGALFATALATGAAAGPAPAAARCAAPTGPGWHSCLKTVHVRLGHGEVRLKKATPRLVVRYDRCPGGSYRRTVTIRTDSGERLARGTAEGRCRDGVARWKLTLRPGSVLPRGTVVRSYWSGVADGETAPGVRLR
jgi:hypothetical protein